MSREVFVPIDRTEDFATAAQLRAGASQLSESFANPIEICDHGTNLDTCGAASGNTA